MTMDPLNSILFGVLLLYGAIFFLDTMFKTCSHVPYLYLLKNTGLSFGVLKVGWFTTAFNRSLQRWGSLRPKILDVWFTFGAWVSFALLPLATGLIIKSTLDALMSDGGSSKQITVLEPMVPGVNLPITDLGYYALTLAICSVVHELGHAVAAVREDVHIFGVGFTLLLVLPVAYVQLSVEHLEALVPKRQLRILCAGIWHNVVLSLAASAILFSLPFVFYPLFDIGTGVSVRHIKPNSPVVGVTGLRIGDRVTALNNCPVTNTGSWQQCIVSAIRHQSPGYCVTSELVAKHDASAAVYQLSDGVIQCCQASSTEHICFEYLEKQDGIAELHQHSCLPGRIVVESAPQLCSTGDDCTTENLHCMKPLLGNSTKLLALHRAGTNAVLFLGHPAEVYHSVQVSDYVPLYRPIPSAVPEAIAHLCKYVAMFSAGLAFVNVIPCFYFDGQHIVLALSHLLLASRVRQKSARRAFAHCITLIGTLVLVINISLTFYKMIFV